MFKKKLSFMLIPGSREKMRQFSISYTFIISSALIIVFLFAANIFLTSSFVQSKADAHELSRLRAENELLAEKYGELEDDVSRISNMYDHLVEKEIVIRNIFNLPEISLEERELGIGGPQKAIDPNLSDAVKLAHKTQTEIDALLRLSRYENEKYEEIYGILAEKKTILDHTPSILPARGYKGRGFGMKEDPFTGYKRFHGGIDISNKTGTPIYATADGVVKYTGNAGDLGRMVTINHGYGYQTRYGHLSKIKVKLGQKVRRGDLIGLMGSTGYSTGPHLHYEVHKNGKRVNPLKYILN
jgi:murein DD-endopeptidase MepM/ murein hydrolase activator NlpD